MKKQNKLIRWGLIAIALTLFGACASNVKKADIANTANPQDEIANLERDHAIAITKNIDVLAAKDFKQSRKWLSEAKSDQAGKQNQDEIINDLRISRGHLERAYQVSQGRAEQAPGLFEARQFAIGAGANEHSSLQDNMKDIDDDVSSEARDFTKVDAEDISDMQKRYVEIERRATILSQLGTSQALFNGAEKNGAPKKAPMTFKKANISLKNAESVISSNVRNSQGYQTAVTAAVTDSRLLNEVMETIKQNGSNLSESAALKMVAQNTKINSLNTDLSASNAESAATKANLNQRNQALSDRINEKNVALDSAQASVAAQKAMEAARSQFSESEAEAYQQGGSLVIRLKKINFASGKADLPGNSLALLAKVSNIAKSMPAQSIKIEGHTDSVGSETQNKELSEKRASAVATYFSTNGFSNVESEGYGFEKPIATNKSKEGRAQNRRVDIVITPDSSASSQ